MYAYTPCTFNLQLIEQQYHNRRTFVFSKTTLNLKCHTYAYIHKQA